MKRKMIITTTNTVEGEEILEYVDVISDRIVAGAGLYSELFAGFTDMFGGRSEKFEARMRELYNQLMHSLEIQAKQRKADAIVGLKIDMDEISGKNMQMFMISGVGTAVRFKKNVTNNTDETNEYDNVLVTSKEIKLKLFSSSANQKLDKVKEHIRNNGSKTQAIDMISEIIEEAMDLGYLDNVFLDRVISWVFSLDCDLNTFIQYCKTYDNNYSKVIFDFVEETLKAGKVGFDKRWNIIVENISFNFDDAYKFLCGVDIIYWDRYAFPLFNKVASEYSRQDIDYINKIIVKLHEADNQFGPGYRAELDSVLMKLQCIVDIANSNESVKQ